MPALLPDRVGKTGAAAMAAQAALRVGRACVTVAIPTSVNDVLEAKLLEAMTVRCLKPKRAPLHGPHWIGS